MNNVLLVGIISLSIFSTYNNKINELMYDYRHICDNIFDEENKESKKLKQYCNKYIICLNYYVFDYMEKCDAIADEETRQLTDLCILINRQCIAASMPLAAPNIQPKKYKQKKISTKIPKTIRNWKGIIPSPIRTPIQKLNRRTNEFLYELMESIENHNRITYTIDDSLRNLINRINNAKSFFAFTLALKTNHKQLPKYAFQMPDLADIIFDYGMSTVEKRMLSISINNLETRFYEESDQGAIFAIQYVFEDLIMHCGHINNYELRELMNFDNKI